MNGAAMGPRLNLSASKRHHTFVVEIRDIDALPMQGYAIWLDSVKTILGTSPHLANIRSVRLVEDLNAIVVEVTHKHMLRINCNSNRVL
jgi:hypothetical protein